MYWIEFTGPCGCFCVEVFICSCGLCRPYSLLDWTRACVMKFGLFCCITFHTVRHLKNASRFGMIATYNTRTYAKTGTSAWFLCTFILVFCCIVHIKSHFICIYLLVIICNAICELMVLGDRNLMNIEKYVLQHQFIIYEWMNDWFIETQQTCIKHCYKQILNHSTAGNTQIKTSTENKLN